MIISHILLFFGGDSAFKWKGQINSEVVHTLPDWAFLPSANFCKSKHSNPFLSNFQVQFQLWIGQVRFLQIDIKLASPWIYFFHFHINVELVHSWFCKDLKANTESDLFLLSNTFISYLILVLSLTRIFAHINQHTVREPVKNYLADFFR